MKSNLHDIEVIFQTQTLKGICVRKDERSKEDIWLAKSQCEVDGVLERGRVVTITVPQPVLEEKGLV